MQFDIRRFDIYRKIPKDLTQPTSAGACISVLSSLFIVYLLYSELMAYLTVDIVSEMYVQDPMNNTERVPVTLDIEVPRMECQYLGLDIQDDLGRHEVGFVEDTNKEPTNDGQGCRFKATFKVNKVPGNFHLSTHAARQQPENPDMNHIIHEVSFGDRVPEGSSLPGSFNPLVEIEKHADNVLSSHDYFLKVVPTFFQDLDGKRLLHPYQYTYAYRGYVQYGHGQRVMPAMWFKYELTPITVKYTEKSKPLYHFLTNSRPVHWHSNFKTYPTIWFHVSIDPVTVKYMERKPPLYHFLTETRDFVIARKEKMPGVWFHYSLHPVTIKYWQKTVPLYHFVMEVCAIVGGTFTVAGIIDSLFFTAAEIFRKAELGKLS